MLAAPASVCQPTVQKVVSQICSCPPGQAALASGPALPRKMVHGLRELGRKGRIGVARVLSVLPKWNFKAAANCKAAWPFFGQQFSVWPSGSARSHGRGPPIP